MSLVAVNPTELPVTLSIGTRRAFDAGRAYHYRFVDEINMYVCDHQTTTNVAGEVMALQVGVDEQGTTWYVAQEGALVDGQGSLLVKLSSARLSASGSLAGTSGS